MRICAMVKWGRPSTPCPAMFVTQLKSFFWVARLGSITQAARQLHLSDLVHDTLILRERGSMTRQLTEQMLDAAGLAPRHVMEIASREGIREAVIRDMGISVFARHEASAHPDIRVLPFAGSVPRLPEYLYCLRERRQARLIAGFLAEAVPGGVLPDME